MSTKTTRYLIFVPPELQQERGFVPNTRSIREKLNKDIEVYLKNGGTVHHVTPRTGEKNV